MPDINQCRRELDRIDHELLNIFIERMKIVDEVTKCKQQTGKPVLDVSREREILKQAVQNSPKELAMPAVTLFKTLMELSRARQREIMSGTGKIQQLISSALADTPAEFPATASVACMGSEGANGQIACDKLFKVANIMYFRNFSGVCKAVAQGICEYGILPIDNTTTGTVDAVYDLMREAGFYIVRSLRLQISHVLLANPGTQFAQIKEIFSHEQALKQCSDFLSGLSGVRITVCDSTADAARQVALSGRNDVAAICARECRQLYQLEVINDAIQNSDFNYTRFICISKTPQIFPGANKISLLAVLPHRPGALYSILAKFSVLGLNLTKLESRPTPGREFEYTFYFDFEASVRTPGIPALLDELAQNTEKLLFLGNYQEL